ncbi:MAG: hypothetical protein IJD67_01075 [Clostridia bacterium]|nr:hypothetical protein [Clostridia bacterium]
MKTKIRIMTSNIWGDYFENPVTIREDELYDVYCRYAPDVIGLQEATVAWHQSTLFSRLKKEYTEVDVNDIVTAWYVEHENDDGVRGVTERPVCNRQNFVPLFYKTDKYDCVDCGWIHFSETPDPSKCVTWAVLKDKETGTSFGVCATHYWWMTGPEHDVIRVKNSVELVALMRKIREKYNCTVFAFGDINCYRASDAFKYLMENGCTELRAVAKDTSDVCTLHGDPVRGEDGKYRGTTTDKGIEYSIDHIIALGEVEAEKYYVITDKDALDATDHSPVYADIEV